MLGMCASGFSELLCPRGTQAGMQTNVTCCCLLASEGSAAWKAKVEQSEKRRQSKLLPQQMRQGGQGKCLQQGPETEGQRENAKCNHGMEMLSLGGKGGSRWGVGVRVRVGGVRGYQHRASQDGDGLWQSGTGSPSSV